MGSNLELVRELRKRCIASIADCKRALETVGDDLEAALDWLENNDCIPRPEPNAMPTPEMQATTARWEAFLALYMEVMQTGRNVTVLVGPLKELDEESQTRILSGIEAGVRERYIPALRLFRALGHEVTIPIMQEAFGPGSSHPVQPFIDEVIHKSVAPEILDFIAKSGRVEYTNGKRIPGRIRALLTSKHLQLRELGGRWLDAWQALLAAGKDPGSYGTYLGVPFAWQSQAFVDACGVANSESDSTPPDLDRIARRWRENERTWLEWVLVDRILEGKNWAREALPWVAGDLALQILGIKPGPIPLREPDVRDLLSEGAGHLLESGDIERMAQGNLLERALHQGRASGDLDAFYKAVGDQFNIGPELIGSSFRDYVELTLDVKSVSGPLEIVGISVALGTPMSLERVLGNNSLGQKPVPAVRIGGDRHADFWLPIIGLRTKIKTFDRIELEKQAAAYLSRPAEYPGPAAVFVEWLTKGGGDGFDPEGMIRFQIALQGRTPSEPLLRELLHQYSTYGHIDVSEWRYYAPDFVLRLAKTINSISDSGLYEALMVATRDEASPEKLARVTTLSYSDHRVNGRLSFTAIQTLEGLSDLCPGLQILELDGNAIRDLSPLATLYCLEEVWLNNNGVVDLSPLAGLVRLRRLMLNSNYGVEDLSPIADLPELTRLSLSENRILDLNPLTKMKALQEISLYGNPLEENLTAANHEILLNLVSRGVEVRVRGIKELRREAIELAVTAARTDPSNLPIYLRTKGGLKLAAFVERIGVRGRAPGEYGTQGNGVLHHLLTNDILRKEDIVDFTEVLTRFIAEGADVNHLNDNGESPLIQHLKSNSNPGPEVVRILVEGGADINHKSKFGYTPIGCLNGSGADPELKKQILDYLVACGGSQ